MVSKAFLVSLFSVLSVILIAGCTQASGVVVPANNTVVLVPDNSTAVVIPIIPITPAVPAVVFIGVTTVSPTNQSMWQSYNNNIIVTFSEAMNPATVNSNTFIVSGPSYRNAPGNYIINGVITHDSTGKVWTFNPSDALVMYSQYNITITTGAKGVSGNDLIRNFTWSFRTTFDQVYAPVPAAPVAPSQVTPVLTKISLTPASTVLSVAGTQQLSASGIDQFGSSMSASINYVSSNSSVATVSASGLVTAVALGTASITASSGSVSNTSSITVAVPYISAAPVDLGAAGSFALLSYAAITDVPASHISGNVGAYPISGTAIGVPCTDMVTGTIYSSDAAGPACKVTDGTGLNTAMLNLGTAYTTGCNSQAVSGYGTNPGAGELSGLTLYPGVYKFTSNAAISGDMYLSGNATDVWVFQIPGTLTMAASTQIHLQGGALAKNVFWAVAGSTYIGGGVGTPSIFNGNILGYQKIQVSTGSTVNGRLYSMTEGIALDQNTVTKPN